VSLSGVNVEGEGAAGKWEENGGLGRREQGMPALKTASFTFQPTSQLG